MAEGVGDAVLTIPTRDAGDLTAQDLVEADGGVLRDVAEALDGSDRLGRIHLEVLHRLADGVDDAVAGGFGAPERAAAAQGLAGDDAGGVLPDELGVLVHHPAHHLRVGADVRGGDVLARADIAPHLLHPAAAQALLLGDGEGGGVNGHAALAAAQGDIGDGALPGHPHRQGAHGVERLGGVEADAALVGAAGVVVLDAVAEEEPERAIVHAHRELELELAGGPAQDLRHLGVQVELPGDVVELALRHLKCIDCFCHLLFS